MNKLYTLCASLVFLGSASKAQVTVNGGITANYTNVNAAFAAINAGTHTGAITIDITASTTEPATPTPLLASGQGAANYTSIILKPTVPASIIGTMVTGRGVLELDGADNVIIDGDVAGGSVNRDLTIQNNAAGTVAATAVIRFIGRTTLGLGATNNTVKNCIIIGSTPGNNGSSGSTLANTYGIYAGANAVALTSGGTGDNYDNLTLQNNEIQSAYYGLYIGGTTANTADNLIISGNTLTTGLTSRAIYLNNVTTSTVTSNEVANLKVTTSISNAGIEVMGTSSSSVTISRNLVYSIWSISTTGWGAYGINLNGGSNHSVVNNVVYDIYTTNYSTTSTTFNAFGIRIVTGTGHKIYYNSVNLFGNYNNASTLAASAAFLVTSTAVTGIDVRNNIFNNIMTSTATTKKFMAVWFPSSYNFLNATLNNNAYTVTNDGDHFVGKIGTTNGVTEYATLGLWQPVSQVNNASNDVASVPVVNAGAPFVANNNLTFAPNTITPIESGATIIASLGLPNIDYNAATRPQTGVNPNTNPDIGAYEFDGLAGVATDAGILALAGPLPYGCYTASEPLVVTIKNFGTSSISNIPVTVVVSGTATQTSTATYAGSIAPSATANFTVANINMLTAGVYSFAAYSSLVGDLNAVNDTMTPTTRTVVPVVPVPQTVSFTGFTGANLSTTFPGWYEATGTVVPTGTTSTWLSQTGLNGGSNITARINLVATSKNDWIVGPKFLATANSQIDFDAAITDASSIVNPDAMGSDDMVRVMVSTDCGVTFAPIFTISATNSLTTNFTNFQVPLGAYAGQAIIVAFLATDGPVDDIESYDFHLDNINIYNTVATDAQPTALVSPALGGCYGASENMVVTIKNNGTSGISNIPVTVVVSGAVTQTSNATYTGSLAAGASVNFTVATLNMTTAGTYSFNAYTSLAGDLNVSNDTTNTFTRLVKPTVSLPQAVNFTGFTGANLPTPFPNWYEATGTSVPTGTTSSWTSQTGLNGTGNITARINLVAAVKTEWIVGPKFTATSNSQISFDAAVTDLSSIVNPDVMGSDDMVRLMLSTDCGLSYTPIFTISATNSLTPAFTNFTIPLSSYAGQDIIVAFLATEGPVDDVESYDFHLDNINLYNALATDAGVAVFSAPTTGVCYSSNENVVVDVKNYGSASISNIPVTVTVSGPIPQVINGTYPGPLAVGASATFTVGTANMSVGGVYGFTCSTSLPGDVNTFNDVSVASRTVTPSISLMGNTSICTGGTSSLTASGAAVSYSWSTGATTNTITVSPSVTTVYTVIATSASSCTTALTPTVTVNNPTISATGALVCDSGTSVLSATAFAAVNWYASPTSTVSLATGNSFTPPAVSTSTTYYAEASSVMSNTILTTMAAGNGSSGNMFDITANNNIVIDGFDMHLAGTTSATVEVWYRTGSFVGFETSNAGWTQVLTTTVTGMGTGNLTPVPSTLNVFVPSGQTYAFYVTVNTGPTVNYTNGTTLGNLYVSNSDLSIFEGKGGGYFSVTNSPRVFNGVVRYTAAGCTSPRVPVTLTVTPSPTLSIAASSTAICSGQNTTLTASGATTYTWSSGAMSATTVETPTASTTYTVIGDASGCTSVDSVAITVSQSPTVSAVSSTSVLCVGSTATLTASGATSYTWSTGSSAPGITVSPTVTTNYTLTGTNGSGCDDTTVVTLMVSACTGIDNVSTNAGEINIYPNPNNGLVNVQIDNVSQDPIFELYDALGKLVISQKLDSEKTSVITSQLARGIYVYRIKSDSGFVKQGKLVKE